MKEKKLSLLSPVKKRLPKPIAQFLILHDYAVILCCILLLAFILRVYNFDTRWGLRSDDMRDAMIGQEALVRGELPLMGSFSSAGPFVFGPLFYWFIMFSYIVFPFSITAPWIMLLIIGVITVYIISLCGKLIGGEKLGILTAFFAAISPQLINRSIALSQHSLIAITASLLLLFFILFWQKKQLRFALFMGLSLGTAISLHYQALNLLIFLPALFFVPKLSIKYRFLALLLMIVGIFIPSIPLALWDSKQEWANLRNILDYFFIAQYRIYVPNSWKLFLFTYFPTYWLYVIGGFKVSALFLMLFTGGMFLFTAIKRHMSLLVFVIGLLFGLLVITNRYYRGERFEGYLIYFIPFIIILTAWAILRLVWYSQKTQFTKQSLSNNPLQTILLGTGIALILSIVYGNFSLLFNNTYTVIRQTKQVQKMVTLLQKNHPDTQFTIYDYQWLTSDDSYPLSAFLKVKNLTVKDGYPIGIARNDAMQKLTNVTIIGKIGESFVVDLKDNDTKYHLGSLWRRVNREDIYDDLMQWTKTRKLTSPFTLKIPFLN